MRSADWLLRMPRLLSQLTFELDALVIEEIKLWGIFQLNLLEICLNNASSHMVLDSRRSLAQLRFVKTVIIVRFIHVQLNWRVKIIWFHWLIVLSIALFAQHMLDVNRVVLAIFLGAESWTSLYLLHRLKKPLSRMRNSWASVDLAQWRQDFTIYASFSSFRILSLLECIGEVALIWDMGIWFGWFAFDRLLIISEELLETFLVAFDISYKGGRKVNDIRSVND